MNKPIAITLLKHIEPYLPRILFIKDVSTGEYKSYIGYKHSVESALEISEQIRVFLADNDSDTSSDSNYLSHICDILVKHYGIDQQTTDTMRLVAESHLRVRDNAEHG